MSCQEVTAEQIIDCMAAQSWKPETRRAYLNTCREGFRYIDMKKVAENIPSVRRPLPHPRPCPENVIRRAFAQADPAERLILALGAECGLRRAEIAAVNSTDAIETENGFVLVVVGKGDRQRIVPVKPKLAKTIQDKNKWPPAYVPMAIIQATELFNPSFLVA